MEDQVKFLKKLKSLGCASLVGLFIENGPFKFSLTPNSPGFQITENPNSWTIGANILYIDNPTGAGFSYNNDPNSNPSSAAESAQDLMTGLKIFFGNGFFPNYQNNPFYIFGESYGGKYALMLSQEIANDPQRTVQLQGIALGNAWVVPNVQDRVYAKFGYSSGIANYFNYVSLNQINERCLRLILNSSYTDAQDKECIPLWLKLITDAGDFNAYDIRIFGNYPFLDILSTYLNSNAFTTAIQANSGGRQFVQFILCSSFLFKKFGSDFQKSVIGMIPDAIKRHKVMVYNGQFDIRCNVYGTSEWLRVTPWDQRFTFNYRTFSPFNLNNIQKGLYKTIGNLTQIIIYGAGHLVPMDQPESSLAMMQRFINGVPLQEGCKNEPCTPIDCPNSCSGRGVCGTGTNVGICFCFGGYIGEDCSIIRRIPFQLGTIENQKGTIFGKSPHIYDLQIDTIGNVTKGLIDVQITLKKTSQTGKLLIFVGGGSNFIQPDETAFENLLNQYPYHNLEDRFYKELFVNDLNRELYPRITILIYNSLDVPAQYEMTFTVQNSGPRVNIATLTLGIILGVGAGISILLSLIILIQCIYARYIQKLQSKYL